MGVNFKNNPVVCVGLEELILSSSLIWAYNITQIKIQTD